MSENCVMEDEALSSDIVEDDGKVQSGVSEQTTNDPEPNLRYADSQSSDDECDLFPKSKRRIHRFSDSDSDDPNAENKSDDNQTTQPNLKENSNSGDPKAIFKTSTNKSRIRKMSDSEDDTSEPELQVSKYAEQMSRIKNKKQKLKDKFSSLITSKSRAPDKKVNTGSSEDNMEGQESNGTEEDDMSSINKIKEIIKERTVALKMSICDPDTSDEECDMNKGIINKSKRDFKKTKLISPKPQRMSAKQAMENMQKIKSESNRMLREKEVSLPYHRPKALSLQDIMKRRRPALSSDGKVLPIKMNDEQLKQYALSLEQRQKEMMELCKSDTEDDEADETSEDTKENVEDTVGKTSECNLDMGLENFETFPIETTETPQENVQVTCLISIDPNAKESQSHNEDPHENGSTVENTSANDVGKESNNKSGDMSAEFELVYNDSIEDNENNDDDVLKEEMQKKTDCDIVETVGEKIEKEQEALAHDKVDSVDINKEVSMGNNKLEDHRDKYQVPVKQNSEVESQLISLNYLDSETNEDILDKDEKVSAKSKDEKPAEDFEINDFPQEDMDMDDINMDEIDSIIENATLIKNVDSPALLKDISVLSVKPKLTGAPGMVIDLDGTDPTAPKKLTGVELLKERFSYFAKIKTPEEMEREREKRQKPGTLHLKLKQELEDQIAEQRSLEWSKRLDGDKQQQKELSAARGDESDPEDDIDKIEAKLNDNDIVEEESSSESEEEPIENDVVIEDKPMKRNPLVADEAEESDADESVKDGTHDDENYEDGVENENGIEDDEEQSSEEDSSESEDEIETNKPKKGRILKAFEDSDDEETPKQQVDETSVVNNNASDEIHSEKPLTSQSQSDVFADSQDDVIQLAQIPKQISGELFPTPDCGNSKSQIEAKEDDLLGTQTFSILNTNNSTKEFDLQLEGSDKLTDVLETNATDKLTVISETQPFDDNLDAVVGMCSGSFSQNYVEFQPPTTQSQLSQSQPIGEDLLNMCTGNFYDNQFVSLQKDNEELNTSDELSQELTPTPKPGNKDDKSSEHENILKSVLDELNEPNIETAKPLKFFFDGKTQNKENEQNANNTQLKKRFVIDSDDEANDNGDGSTEKKKKLKKKKLEDRALQFSDDEEEEEYSDMNDEEILSENDEEKLVEYDSEENEVEVLPEIVKKKKKKASEFFEQEAELTSEDEWVGSGDEDEAGLDRMEREAGDDDTFHQGQLQRELGQIHMRDVLDQDKREVRLLQELLFEDGDLGAGGRQRKFRWRNADGEEASGTVPDEFADTQEEEFESEEQWRKQRHEREMFLRQLKSEGEKDDDLDVSVNRTTIIKANLNSRTMSSLLEEVNQTRTEAAALPTAEKKTMLDIPSPKKSFPVFKQNYHSSLLTRGRGALARLAALAAPLVAAEPKHTAANGNGNFVFAAIAPEDLEPKVTKRKAENNVGTPRLVKKMKTEEKQKYMKSSLLDHFKTFN